MLDGIHGLRFHSQRQPQQQPMSTGVVHRISKQCFAASSQNKFFRIAVVEQDVLNCVAQCGNVATRSVNRNKIQSPHTDPGVVRDNVELPFCLVEFLNAVLQSQTRIDCKMRIGNCGVVLRSRVQFLALYRAAQAGLQIEHRSIGQPSFPG